MPMGCEICDGQQLTGSLVPATMFYHSTLHKERKATYEKDFGDFDLGRDACGSDRACGNGLC